MSDLERPEPAADQPAESEMLQEGLVSTGPDTHDVGASPATDEPLTFDLEALFGDLPYRLPTPPYPVPFPGELELYSGPASLDGAPLVEGAAVRLTADGRNTIEASFELPTHGVRDYIDARDPVPFQADGFDVAPALIFNAQSSEPRDGILFSSVRARLMGFRQPAVTTTAIDFVGFNLPDWIGQPVRDDRGVARARLVLNAGDFEIILDHHRARPEKDEMAKAGSGLTTIGRLQRKDLAEFCTDDPGVELAFNALTWTFVFTSASWAAVPTLLTATSVAGQPWQAAHLRKRTSHRDNHNWFDPLYAGSILEVYQGLLAKLQDPLWDLPIREAINWYADAHGAEGTTVGHLIWAQTGLELLGWMQLTQGPQASQTENGYNAAFAAQKIRDLLAEFHIDPSIPPAYRGLHTFASNLKNAGIGAAGDPLDGPSLMTHVRNSYVHPRQRGRHIHMDQGTHGEATRLALEYLELCLLGVLGVVAPVRIRSLNAVQTPPWVPSVLPLRRR